MATKLTHNGIVESFSLKFKLEWLLFLIFLIFSLSFNFHALWIFYDIIAILLILFFITTNGLRITAGQGAFLFLALSYFIVIVLLNDHVLMGLLSVWDTFKHLAYVRLISGVVNDRNSSRAEMFGALMYKLVFLLFVIQIGVVVLQFQQGIFFDNIAGTFGDGGSHALGYLSVLFIVASIVMNKGRLFLLGAIAMSFLINLLAENAGFFVFLAIVLFGLYFPRLSVAGMVRPANVMLALVFLLLGYFVSGISLYSEKTLGDVVTERLNVFDHSTTGMGESDTVGRGASFLLASELGGWFGRGPGAYSDIYLLDGYDSLSVVGEQINISEFTHLVAESGFIGYALVVMVYSVFLSALFRSVRYKMIAIGLLLVCTQYTAVLMNESHFFIFLLIMFFLFFHDSRAKNKRSLNRRAIYGPYNRYI